MPLGVDRPAELDDPLRLGRRQAGHHLVEQQEPRLGRQGARELEPLAIRERETTGGPVGPVLETHQGEDLSGLPVAAPNGRVRASAPTRTFSSTVSPGNGLTIWKVRARPRRQTWWGRSPGWTRRRGARPARPG